MRPFLCKIHVQAVRQFFEADSWEDIVGPPTTSCVAEMDSGVQQEREQQLKASLRAQEELIIGAGKRRSVKGNVFVTNEYKLWTVSSPTGMFLACLQCI